MSEFPRRRSPSLILAPTSAYPCPTLVLPPSAKRVSDTKTPTLALRVATGLPPRRFLAHFPIHVRGTLVPTPFAVPHKGLPYPFAHASISSAACAFMYCRMRALVRYFPNFSSSWRFPLGNIYSASSTSRTFCASAVGVNGFCRNGRPILSTPFETAAVFGYPDMKSTLRPGR